jgi:hypothetical protein
MNISSFTIKIQKVTKKPIGLKDKIKVNQNAKLEFKWVIQFNQRL